MTPMTRERARAFAAAIGCIAVCLLFFMTAVVPLPVPLYFPLSRRFGLGPAQELSMDYYGRSLLALAPGLLLSMVTYPLLRRLPEKRAVLLLLCAYAATALLLCVGLYGYQLSTRQLMPEPLPAWYQPK